MRMIPLIIVTEDKEPVINALETSSQKYFKWLNTTFKTFEKANSYKIHLLLGCNEPSTLVIDDSSIEENTKEVLLAIAIDKNLKFDNHVNSFCKKACKKLNTLARVAPYIKVEKKKNNHENIHRTSIWILSLSLNVP